MTESSVGETADHDNSDFLIDRVAEASSSSRLIQVFAGSTKRHCLPECDATPLDMRSHRGIIDYQPSELVVTARAGTPLQEVNALLAKERQMLASTPPFRVYNPNAAIEGAATAGTATVGGAVATGLSGPTRPFGGSLRDAVLGVEMINGLGEHLRFGGQVIKNVAGYDVSRLQAGAWGGLGALLAISLRVQPIWPCETTVFLRYSPQEAVSKLPRLRLKDWPLQSTVWHQGSLALRFAGQSSGVQQAVAALPSETKLEGKESALFWDDWRDQQTDFFRSDGDKRATGQRLWRLITPPAAPLPVIPSPGTPNPLVEESTFGSGWAMEWANGLRWLWSNNADAVLNYAHQVGGWAWPIGGAMPVPAAQRQYMHAIKAAFDPHNVFASGLRFDHAD